MSKRVQIAVVREATLNAKPTDTHYLAEGGLRISRKNAIALKGTTLYYQEVVDLGQITGSDFIPVRDIPVYTTDSEPVLAMQPHMLTLVEVPETTVNPYEINSSVSNVIQVDPAMLLQNSASVEVVEAPVKAAPVVTEESAPVKRRPGRPRKVVEMAAKPDPVIVEPVVKADPEPEVTEEIPAAPAAINYFEVEEAETEVAKQDDESTFLIAPTGTPPTPSPKTEFSFEIDDEEPPPQASVAEPVSLGFEVEEDEPAASYADAEEVTQEVPAMPIDTEDFSDVAPGLFDE